MNYLDLMRKRRSIRKYTLDPLTPVQIDAINQELDVINRESGFNFQLIVNNDIAFSNPIKTLGMFKNVRNFIALVGKDDKFAPKGGTFNKVGYYGARVLLFLTSLDLSTCWVALSYSKGRTEAIVESDEKVYSLITVGTRLNPLPSSRRTKSITEISDYNPKDPEWYKNGVMGAMLAPSTLGLQPVYITFDKADDKVYVKHSADNINSLDTGIVQYFFERAADHDGLKIVLNSLFER